MPWLRAVSAFLFVLVAGAGAQARPRSFALNWVRDAGAESCITSRELARVIERAVGPVFALPADAQLSIEGHVQRDQPLGWRARISVSDARGELLGTRALATAKADCRALNVQIGLVVAMIIDPEIALGDLPEELLANFGTEGGDPAAELLAELRAEQPVTPKSDAPAAPPQVDTQPPTDSRPTPDIPIPVDEWSVQGGLAIGSDFLANVSMGPWVGVAYRFSRAWSLVLRNVLWLPNDTVLSEDSGSISFSMWLSTFAACVTPLHTAAFGWDACAGMSLGVRWSDTSALARVFDPVDWALGPSLSTQLSYQPMDSLTLLATLAVDIAVRRPQFVYTNTVGQERSLFTVGRFAPWACLGAAWKF